MNLHLSEEQRFLRDAAERLFRERSTPAQVRSAEADPETPGFDPNLWRELHESGFATMRVPESHGGAGASLLDALLVAEEAGRRLAAVPFAECNAAARLLCQLDGDAATQWLQRVLAGAVVVLAPQPVNRENDLVIPYGAAAAAALVLNGDTVHIVERAALAARGSIARNAVALVDAHAVFEGCAVLGRGSVARRAFLAAIEEWKLLSAGALAGLARQALQLGAAYARERMAFGRPIGSFQGIAHPLADALTEVDGAQLLTWRAAWAIGAKRSDAAAAVSMAFWWSAQTAAAATARALHVFGGYGVSLEYDIQLYYRRAKGWALAAGDPHGELLRIAQRLWDAPDVPLPDSGASALAFGVGARAESFAEEVRVFFESTLTAELRAKAHHSVDGFDAGFNRLLARAGLLFPHWPEEYGGRARDAFDMAALAEVFEEYGFQRITTPITNQVAQILMRFGNAELKNEVLPRFACGDALACMGFTEPSCGSDVFAATTRAQRDGDGWRIDGQKIFTTAGNLAQYIFLLARTDPAAPKHKGLTFFLVPMATPGVEVQPIHTLQDETTNVTFLSDVRIDDRYRVGEINGGGAIMAATLELEHGGDQYRISYAGMFKHAVEWARRRMRDGRPLLGHDDVRRRLARIAVHTTIAEVLCHRAIWAVADQVPGRAAYGPMAKLFSTETYQRDAGELMDLAAPESLFPDLDGSGHIELGYRQSIGMTIYGGTSEIHRSLIAEQGLGMPRSRT